MKAFKVCMLGSGGVGKTAISLQFVRGEFSESYIPTIEDEFNKNVKVDDETVQLEIIDTAGQEDFKDLRHRYMKDCDGFVFVYSVVDQTSKSALSELYNDCKSVKGSPPKCVICGNKCDYPEKDKKVSKAEVETLVNSWEGAMVFETSAKTNIGIVEAFDAITRSLMNKPLKASTQASPSSGGGCCLVE